MRRRGCVLVALVVAAAGSFGCSDVEFSTSEGDNWAERDVNLHTKGRYQLSNVKCPGMTEDRDEYDGKSIDCTATATLTDGSTKPIKLSIAYEKCSTNNTCQNIDITGDVQVRVRPN